VIYLFSLLAKFWLLVSVRFLLFSGFYLSGQLTMTFDFLAGMAGEQRSWSNSMRFPDSGP